MDVQELFLCCLFKAGTRNWLRNLLMSVLQNMLSHSRTANSTSKYQKNVPTSKQKPLSWFFWELICMPAFNIFAKYVALGILFASLSVHWWWTWPSSSKTAWCSMDYMGIVKQSWEFLSGCDRYSGDPVIAAPPASSQCSQILNKCSWTIFRVRIVPSVIAALVGFNYGSHSIFKHLDSVFSYCYSWWSAK